MTQGMQFYWGNYIHPAGEVFPERVVTEHQYSERGVKWATEYRLHVKGDFIKTEGTQLTPSEITQRIALMEEAYSQDYKDCGFLMNGAPTPHAIVSGNPYNLSGNQVIFKSWDNVIPTEYQNTRSFYVIIRAMFLTFYENVMQFRETVEKIGDGGPLWEMYNTVDGPQRVDLLPQTKVTHVQRGSIIGTIGRINPPPPLWPLEHQGWRRVVRYSNPEYLGSPQFSVPCKYRTDYAYFFTRNGPDAVQGSDWYSG